MKKILLSLILVVITATAFSQSGDITVTIVSSEPGTGITSIDYEFTGLEDKIYDLTVEVKFDDADYVPVPEAHLSGDYTEVSGTGASFTGNIVWNGAVSFPDRYHEETKIRIIATTIWLRDNTTEIVDVTNPATGKTWMDRNLGASRAAISSDDTDAYGDLYQWGREADGHEKRNSPTTTTLSTSDSPGHGNFILVNSYPTDWRSPGNNNLWQGVYGTNNPCPSGYRLPTKAEWETERQSWSSNNAAGAYASPLKLPVAGVRGRSSGSLLALDTSGYYWASAGYYLSFNSSNAGTGSNHRSVGASVRCLKD